MVSLLRPTHSTSRQLTCNFEKLYGQLTPSYVIDNKNRQELTMPYCHWESKQKRSTGHKCRVSASTPKRPSQVHTYPFFCQDPQHFLLQVHLREYHLSAVGWINVRCVSRVEQSGLWRFHLRMKREWILETLPQCVFWKLLNGHLHANTLNDEALTPSTKIVKTLCIHH